MSRISSSSLRPCPRGDSSAPPRGLDSLVLYEQTTSQKTSQNKHLFYMGSFQRNIERCGCIRYLTNYFVSTKYFVSAMFVLCIAERGTDMKHDTPVTQQLYNFHRSGKTMADLNGRQLQVPGGLRLRVLDLGARRPRRLQQWARTQLRLCQNHDITIEGIRICIKRVRSIKNSVELILFLQYFNKRNCVVHTLPAHIQRRIVCTVKICRVLYQQVPYQGKTKNHRV